MVCFLGYPQPFSSHPEWDLGTHKLRVLWLGNLVCENSLVSKKTHVSLCEALSIYCQLRGSVKGSPWGLVRLHEELCCLLQCVFWSGVLGLCREPPLSFGFGGAWAGTLRLVLGRVGEPLGLVSPAVGVEGRTCCFWGFCFLLCAVVSQSLGPVTRDIQRAPSAGLSHGNVTSGQWARGGRCWLSSWGHLCPSPASHRSYGYLLRLEWLSKTS